MTQTTITPYFGFNGKTPEAMEFYKGCFGGEVTMMKMADTPGCPAGMEDQIMHAELKSDAIRLYASDMAYPEGFVPGNNVSMNVNCASEEEIDRLYAYLSQWGAVLDSLKLAFWGDKFGTVKDKYGVYRMLTYPMPK